MCNIGFYYQVWHTSKLSTFEALKQLRLIYPNNELILVIAGLSKNSVEEYDRDFTQIIKDKFNISKIDYIFTEDSPYMAKCYLSIPDIDQVRDEYIKFSHLWLDKFVSLPSDDMDIMVNCSDDWYPLREIPIDCDIDVCGRYAHWSDWMNEEKLRPKFNFLKEDLLIWLAHGHYLNIKKLKQKYTPENKAYLESVLKEVIDPKIPLFLDYMHCLWNVIAFDTFENDNYTLEVNAFSINSQEDSCGFPAIHGGTGLHFVPISEEMIQLGIK